MQITLSGVSLHYEQFGSGDQHILMLHGWGCEIKHFEPSAKALKDRYHVTVIDFPAHGASSRPPKPWGVSEFANCIKELIVALNIAPCDIVAHSFGGRVALYLGANAPQLVKRLVITGGAGLRKPQTEEQKKRSQRYQQHKKLFENIIAWGGPFKTLGEKGMRKLRQKFGSADYNALDEEMRKTFVKVISEDLSPLLPKIQASTLLVWGENDQDTPLWMGKEMEKQIPDAGLVLFENDDHYAYLRQWPRFVRVLEAFLK